MGATLYAVGEARGRERSAAHSQESKVLPRVCQGSELLLAALTGRSLTIGRALLGVDGSFRCSDLKKPRVVAGFCRKWGIIRQSPLP
jgi:hypothetical protein